MLHGENTRRRAASEVRTYMQCLASVSVCISLEGITRRRKKSKTISSSLWGLALCLRNDGSLQPHRHLGRGVSLLSLWQRPTVLPMSLSLSSLVATVGQHSPVPLDSSWGHVTSSRRCVQGIRVPPGLRGYELGCLFHPFSFPVPCRGGRSPGIRDTPWKKPRFPSGSGVELLLVSPR